MATVEELRKELNADLGACHLALFRDDKGVLESIDSLIAAARAEGAAQERERIRKASVGTRAIDITYGAVDHPTANDTMYWHMAYLIPASVLASNETTLDKAGVTLRGQHGVDW
jgi:hypothetical protein